MAARACRPRRAALHCPWPRRAALARRRRAGLPAGPPGAGVLWQGAQAAPGAGHRGGVPAHHAAAAGGRGRRQVGPGPGAARPLGWQPLPLRCCRAPRGRCQPADGWSAMQGGVSASDDEGLLQLQPASSPPHRPATPAAGPSRRCCSKPASSGARRARRRTPRRARPWWWWRTPCPPAPRPWTPTGGRGSPSRTTWARCCAAWRRASRCTPRCGWGPARARLTARCPTCWGA
jgi:hypothetical protein